MKILKFLISSVAAICLLHAPTANAETEKYTNARDARGSKSAEEQIKSLTTELIQAILKGDTSFYQKYYADDAVSIHSNGHVYTKARDIAELKHGSLKYDSYDVRDEKIRIYGNTAVVDILNSGKGLLESKPFNAGFRTVYIWVKLNGNWKLVSRQVTKISAGQ